MADVAVEQLPIVSSAVGSRTGDPAARLPRAEQPGRLVHKGMPEQIDSTRCCSAYQAMQ